jgi:hypothetical protein
VLGDERVHYEVGCLNHPVFDGVRVSALSTPHSSYLLPIS